MFQKKLLMCMSQQAEPKDLQVNVFVYVVIWNVNSVKINEFSCSQMLLLCSDSTTNATEKAFKVHVTRSSTKAVATKGVCVCVCVCFNLVFNFQSLRLIQVLMFQRKLLTFMSTQAGQSDLHVNVCIYVILLIWDAYSVKINDLSCSHDASFVFRLNY